MPLREVNDAYFRERTAIDAIGAAVERPLQGGDAVSTLPPVADDTLKPRVDFLQTAFLWLAGITFAAIASIVLIAVNLSNATNTRLDKSIEATSSLNREVGQVGVKVNESNRRLERIEAKLDRLQPTR